MAAMTVRRWPGLLAIAIVCAIVCVPGARSESQPREFQTKAMFELEVGSSKVLRPGSSRIVAQSGFVTLVHGLVPGNSDGLEIRFFTKPITESARIDILEQDARELRKSDHAVLVLFLGRERRPWQVNLSYVVPGTTVARTVAWKPEELQQFASYRFDGKRLQLKSKGVYEESGNERLKLSWDVDVDLPVFERIKR